MDMFQELEDVNVLSTYGLILPKLAINFETCSEKQARRVIEFLFPIFLHNVIRVQDFPQREKLAVALEQMEQNIADNAQNAMVQELLTCGLQGKVCDAGGLPTKIDAKRAVTLYLARNEWDTLYRTFYLRVVKLLVKHRRELGRWLKQQSGQETGSQGVA
jgi:hypothetical protein